MLLAVAVCWAADVKRVPVTDEGYQSYLVARDKARAADGEGDYLASYNAYLEAAEVTPFGWVKAWMLNNGAVELMKSKKPLDKATVQKALDTLKQAQPLVDVDRPENRKSAARQIEKNIARCESML
jgi:hypothetical protein